MGRYILSKVEEFISAEIKWEVTDTKYPEELGGPNKSIAVFIDQAMATNFITWQTADDAKFEASLADVNNRYGEALSHLKDEDCKLAIKRIAESEGEKGRDSDCG